MTQHLMVRQPGAPVASQPQPNFGAASSLAATLEARTLRIAPGVYRFPAGAGLTDGERQAIGFEIADLRDLQRSTVPADGGVVVEEVADQICASFAAKDGGTDQAIYDGFLIALPGRSCAAVREAVRRLIRSVAPTRYSRKWRIGPAELAEYAMAIETEWAVEEQRLANLLAMETEAPSEPERQPTPEEMADVRARAARLGRRGRDVPEGGDVGKPSFGTAVSRVTADLARRRAETSNPNDLNRRPA